MSADVGQLEALDFTAYELARVEEYSAAHAAEYPEAPALQVLRSAMLARLTWDHSCGTQFEDPSFVARFTALREHVIAAGCDEARDLPPILTAVAATAAARVERNS